MQFTSFCLGTAAILSSLALGQNLGKPTLWKNGIDSKINPGLLNYTKSATYKSTNWANTAIIPQPCYQEVKNNNLDPVDVVVYSVMYSDCSTPWTFCWHKSAPISQASLVDLFGRLPVRERQWARYIIGVPGGGTAYSTDANTVLQGDVPYPSVFQHEITHSVDGYANGGGLSTRAAWQNAINSDTCVPDDYSNSDRAEDFAQVGVIALFDEVYPGGNSAAFGDSWRCLFQQFQTWKTLVSPEYIYGSTCSRRWPDSTSVNKSTGQAVKRSEDEISIQGDNFPSPYFSGVTQYNITATEYDEEARKIAEANFAAWHTDPALSKKSTRFVKW